jgi:hypothetical protein
MPFDYFWWILLVIVTLSFVYLLKDKKIKLVTNENIKPQLSRQKNFAEQVIVQVSIFLIFVIQIKDEDIKKSIIVLLMMMLVYSVYRKNIK